MQAPPPHLVDTDPRAIRYPSQGNIMRYGAFDRFREYLGQVAYPTSFVGRPMGPVGVFLPSSVTARPDLDQYVACQAPDFTGKFSRGAPKQRMATE